MTDGAPSDTDVSRKARRRLQGLAVVGLLLCVLTVIAVPLLVRLFNLIVIGGVPLGYYLSAQGILAFLALAAMAYAGLADRFDAAGRPVTGDPVSGDHASDAR